MNDRAAPADFAAAMAEACRAARRFMGATAPNPPVGAAALDGEGRILAVAAHERAGTAHAEARLIALCGERGILAEVRTLCVTLEPCNHHGRTPPCSEAIVAAAIPHVVIGTRDPNPGVKGGGIERLRAAGIRIEEGVAEESCRQLLHAFAFSTVQGRPWVTVKRAFDERGSMVPPPGRKTFTSEPSLVLAHRLRKKADAILTGSGTVLADRPEFTVRRVPDHPGKRRWLAILDRRRRVPEAYLTAAAERGLDAIVYQDIDAALADLQRRGVRDLLVEAGPALSDAILAGPSWCLAVDIQKGAPDRVSWRFNMAAPIPFAVDSFDPEAILPL
jgi:diaminohydroxyphosphoribosylaminopyrimidine deaminase/5-amino-6-(5-phosphoribosylamino)uracil reductase